MAGCDPLNSTSRKFSYSSAVGNCLRKSASAWLMRAEGIVIFRRCASWYTNSSKMIICSAPLRISGSSSLGTVPPCWRAYGNIVKISRCRSRSVKTAPFTRATGCTVDWIDTGAALTAAVGACDATWANVATLTRSTVPIRRADFIATFLPTSKMRGEISSLPFRVEVIRTSFQRCCRSSRWLRHHGTGGRTAPSGWSSASCCPGCKDHARRTSWRSCPPVDQSSLRS